MKLPELRSNIKISFIAKIPSHMEIITAKLLNQWCMNVSALIKQMAHKDNASLSHDVHHESIIIAIAFSTKLSTKSILFSGN